MLPPKLRCGMVLSASELLRIWLALHTLAGVDGIHVSNDVFNV